MVWIRLVLALLALTWAYSARADLTPVAPPPGLLPDDPARMAIIRHKHASIVRRAERMCGQQYGWYGGASFRACVIGSVENGLTVSQDPMLSAYHRSLPFPARYQWRSPGPTPWQMR